MCEKKGALGGKLGCFAVAPYAGAWIEILAKASKTYAILVAPYAGAWIEIVANIVAVIASVVSLPTRERGLKYEQDKNDATNAGRSLRGSVD